MARIAVLTLAGALSAATLAHAQTPPIVPPSPGSQVFITGQASMDGGPRTGGVEWLQPARGTPVTLDLGAFTGASADGWFSYARVGGLLRRGGTVVAGFVDFGGGKEQTTSFGYSRVRAMASAPTAVSGLYVDGDVDHVRMAGSVVTGLRVGGMKRLSSRISATLSGHVYAAAGDVDPAVSVRADYSLHGGRIMGGVFVSRRALLTSGPVNVNPTLYATRSVFFGADVPAGAQTVTAALDLSEQARGRVATLLVGLKVPLQ